ncbi:MAG: hypothetical protein K6G85_02910 [Eubacterium sp.]|nr:hypothetical protein [Eubacterium sp.]
MRKITKKIIALGLSVSIVTTLNGCDTFRKTNQGKTNLSWYMKTTDDNENPYKLGGKGVVTAVALEDRYSEQYAIVQDNQVFLNISMVQKEVDPRFYWNEKSKKIMFTNAQKIYESEINTDKIGNEKVSFITGILDKDQCYVNAEFVKRYVDYSFEYIKEKNGTPARVVMTYRPGEVSVMTVDEDMEMRTGGDYQNLIVTTVPEDSKVTVIEESKNWNLVRTKDGMIGYMPVSSLTEKKREKRSFKSDEGEYTHQLMDGKVSMVWHLLTQMAANASLSNKLENVKGLNVISPTWFSLKDGKGNVESIASAEYVQTAHNANLQVWGVISDLDTQGKKNIGKVLKSNQARRKMVSDLISYAQVYQMDGINVDFEMISEKVSQDYLQFLRELSIQCRQKGLVLSVDNYVPSASTDYYDRKQQGMLADYIIVMSYDEHATSEDGAGSVSSLGYTEQSIKDTVEQVGDASRVINGMPFYTTAWIETPVDQSDGSGTLISDSVNGDYYLTSQDISMDTATELYKKAGSTPVFDDNTGQNQVSYQKGDKFVTIWLEDETSVKSRLELMNQYKLGGAAYWSLGQESGKIWSVIQSYFK